MPFGVLAVVYHATAAGGTKDTPVHDTTVARTAAELAALGEMTGAEMAENVGAQWELPGAAARRNGGRRRAFWPGGGPSCTLPDRREAAFLARLSAAVRPPWRFPRSCARRTFSASPSARRLESCASRV